MLNFKCHVLQKNTYIQVLKAKDVVEMQCRSVLEVEKCHMRPKSYNIYIKLL